MKYFVKGITGIFLAIIFFLPIRSSFGAIFSDRYEDKLFGIVKYVREGPCLSDPNPGFRPTVLRF